MRIQTVILSALAAYCSATKTLDLSGDIPAESKLGSQLLSKARQLNQGEEIDYTWLNKWSIRFHSCHTIHLFGGGEEEQRQEEGGSPVGNQHLVKFKLCPSDSECDKCKNGGEYVVQMRQFLEIYLETKQELQENQCKAVEENCNCNYYNGDDEACQAKCYADAGLDFCGEDENEFEVDKFVECAEAEFSNNAYYASTYFIGPVCASSGSAVNMGVFKDMSCSTPAGSGVYEKYNYGASLPFSSKSIVDNSCVSCKEYDEDENNNNNNNNYYEAAEPIELCQNLYMQSAKCENQMQGKTYPDSGSCTYINKIIPALENVYEKDGKTGSPWSTAFAWIFLVTTLVASAGFYHFYVIAKRKTVNLQDNGGSMI